MLEHTIEIFTAPNGAQSVCVGQIGENSDLIAIFELGTHSHVDLLSYLGKVQYGSDDMCSA